TLDNDFKNAALSALPAGKGFNQIVQSVALSPDESKLYLGGAFTLLDGVYWNYRSASLNSDGTVNTSFPFQSYPEDVEPEDICQGIEAGDGFNISSNATNGGGNIFINAIVLDGTDIVVGGSVTTYTSKLNNQDNVSAMGISRISLSGGLLNTTFQTNANNAGITNTVYAIAKESSGNFLVGGTFGLKRINATGTLVADLTSVLGASPLVRS